MPALTRSERLAAEAAARLAPKPAEPAVRASRAAHALNDQRVTLARGEGIPVYRNGASVTPSARVGIVWLVEVSAEHGERAVVDFGATSSGIALRIVTPITNLEIAK